MLMAPLLRPTVVERLKTKYTRPGTLFVRTVSRLVMASSRQPGNSASRRLLNHPQSASGISERRACWALAQPRSTQRHSGQPSADEEPIGKWVVERAVQVGQHSYQRIMPPLQIEGWATNHNRVERIGQREGLKAPARPRPWRFAGSQCPASRHGHSRAQESEANPGAASAANTSN